MYHYWGCTSINRPLPYSYRYMKPENVNKNSKKCETLNHKKILDREGNVETL